MAEIALAVMVIQALILLLIALPFGLNIHPIGMLLMLALPPLSFAPGWLRVIASANPLAYAVDAARAIFNNNLGDQSVGVAVTLLDVLAIIASASAAWQFGHAVA